MSALYRPLHGIVGWASDLSAFSKDGIAWSCQICQVTPPMHANASDVGNSLFGFGLHTSARHQFVIESQRWECS